MMKKEIKIIFTTIFLILVENHIFSIWRVIKNEIAHFHAIVVFSILYYYLL